MGEVVFFLLGANFWNMLGASPMGSAASRRLWTFLRVRLHSCRLHPFMVCQKKLELTFFPCRFFLSCESLMRFDHD